MTVRAATNAFVGHGAKRQRPNESGLEMNDGSYADYLVIATGPA